MKKLFIVIVLFFILISGTNKPEFSLANYFSGEYYAYTESPVLDDYINLGFCYMNNGKIKNNKLLIGESMVIKNLEVSSAIKVLNAKVIKTEYLQTGAVVIYAYSNYIPNHVKVFDNNVNLQIACYDNYSVVGWPLILGSY